MNLREINKKKYEDALKAYQEQIVEIAILEYELKSLGEKKENASKDAYDNLKKRIEKEYEELAVLSQAVTDTFKALQTEEDVVAEEVDLDSLEDLKYSEKYYELSDRYADQLEHIEHLEQELTDLGEQNPNASTEEFEAKKKEIDDAYDILAVLAAELSKEVETYEEDEEITLEDLKKEIDKAIDEVKEDEPLTEEDKEIINELEIEEIKRLRKEIEQYQKDIKANIRRKGELIRKDNAKQENLKGFDEVVRQLEEKIIRNKEELEYYLARHPELKNDKEEVKLGLGFKELGKYLESYLYLTGNIEEKVHTDVTDSYEDQRNISITLKLDSGYTYHYNDARNPKTGEDYGYICWIAHTKDNSHINPEDFATSADVWADKCDRIFQFRGDRKAGIQVQELELKEDGNLHPIYVYETKNDQIVKGIVGEEHLRTVTVSSMLAEIDKRLYEIINKQEEQIENNEMTEFELDKAEIERLENDNKELIKHRNANEKRKLQLIEMDDAKKENLKGFDEAIRQINEEIKINEEIIASIKTKYPDIYKEEVVEIVPQEEEKATEEEIKEAIEEALENVKLSEQEEVVEENDEDILGLLNSEEIAQIIDKKLDEIYGKNEIDKEENNEINLEDIKKEIDKEINEIKLEEEIQPDEIKEIIENEMNKVDVELPVDYEEIFEGTFIIDGYLTEEEQKEKVFNLMEQAGIKLTDEEKRVLVISYEGVEDNDGLSETQTTRFIVRKPIEKVPYKQPDYEEDYQNDENEVNKQEENIKQEDEKEFIQTMTPNGVQMIEKITLYVDLDNNEVYGKDYLFKRFNMEKQSKKVIIDGYSCYKMENDYVEYIIRNQNNNYSPYVVETREVRMGKKEIEEEKHKVDEKTTELANEMSLAEKYMLILHPEYKDINKLDQEEQRNLLIDYWYIRDNYKDIDNLFSKMKNYYSGADIDDKSLLISILPKYVVEQEITRRKERGEKFISEEEYKQAIYKGLANKDRYLPDWSYTETMLSEISSVNTKNIIMSQNIEIDKDFHVDKPELIKPKHKEVEVNYQIDSLDNLRNRINNSLRDYQRGRTTVDEAIHNLARIFQENTTAINNALEYVENKDKIRHALMNIINDRNSLYEMCGIIVGELTDNEQIQYLNLEDAFKITDLDGELYEQIVTYLMSTLLIQQTESQIIVDSKVVDCIKSNNKVR